MLGKLAQSRFDAQQLFAVDQLPCHSVLAHQRGCVASGVEGLLVGVVVGNAALQPLVFNAGAGHHLFQCGVAVGAQRHQLLHVALEGAVVAVGQKLKSPLVLQPARAQRVLRTEQQRSFLAEHPFQGFEGCIAVGPGLAVADGDLRRIGKTGFHGGVRLPLHDGDLVAALQEVPRGADANDACAKNNNFHGASVAESVL